MAPGRRPTPGSVSTTAERYAVAQLLYKVAEANDRLGLPYGGAIRRGTSVLLEVPTTITDPTAVTCAGCGTPIDQPANGGRRKWCRDACRTRHRRR